MHVNFDIIHSSDMRGVQNIAGSFLSHTKCSNREKSHHVSINVTLIRSTLIAGSRFTGGQ